MIRRLHDLTIGQKRALWAWAFLALPVVFYVAIRFYPTAEAFRASFTNWNIVGRMEYIGARQLCAARAGPRVLEGDRQHVRVSRPRRADQHAAVVRHRLLPRPRALRPRAPARALFHSAPDHRRGDGLGVALVLPAAAGRRVQRVADRAGLRPDAVPAFHHAGAARGAGAGDLGRHRIPDRDLPGRPEGDPAHLLRSRGDRRRRRVARAVRGHAAAAAPDDRVPRGHELDRLPAHLRLRLCDDQRPGRAARRDQAAGAEDLRDRVQALRDGLRRGADGDAVRDPARDLAPADRSCCAADDRDAQTVAGKRRRLDAAAPGRHRHGDAVRLHAGAARSSSTTRSTSCRSLPREPTLDNYRRLFERSGSCAGSSIRC